MTVHRRHYLDTKSINGVFLTTVGGLPLDWTATGYTPKIAIETDAGTLTVAATAITPHPQAQFTLDSTNNWVYRAQHNYEVGQIWVPSTSGSLSGTGLTAATRYII